MRRFACSLALLVSACGATESPGDFWEATSARGSTNRVAEARPTIDPRFTERAQEIARTYTELVRLKDTPALAPTACWAPRTDRPLVSRARTATSHGRKLYFLWVDDVAAYRGCETGIQPVGQVLVKESFRAVELEPGHDEYDGLDEFGEAVEIQGARWKVGAPSDLFLMFKLAPEEAGTDAGWVYATTTRDGEVTSAGRVASCMECHQDAPLDRMFGARAMHDVASSASEAWMIRFYEEH